MQVSEQTDSLRVLGTDPVDYLVSPRVLACMIAGPVLNILCFAMGELATLLGTTRLSLTQGCAHCSLVACRVSALLQTICVPKHCVKLLCRCLADRH